MFHEKPLNFSNLDGTISALGAILRFEHAAALFFAQSMGGAKNSARPTKNIVLFYGAYRAGNVFKAKLANKLSRFSIGGATFRARGIVTEQAAIGFSKCLGQIKPFAHLHKFIYVAHY
jgi:hypothetical protein